MMNMLVWIVGNIWWKCAYSLLMPSVSSVWHGGFGEYFEIRKGGNYNDVAYCHLRPPDAMAFLT